MLFAGAILLGILKATGTTLVTHPALVGEIANVISNIDISSFTSHLPEGSESLHDRISQAENEKRLYVHNSGTVNLSLPYNETTFVDNLTKVIELFFKDAKQTSIVVHEVLKKASHVPLMTALFEVHEIKHEANDVKITSLTFSPIQTDKVWNLYFTTWGTSYVNINIHKKELVLLEPKC